MTTETERTTERTMRAYLETLLDRGDFAAHFAVDVVWTTMETGEEVRGRDAVRDLIVWFHVQAFDATPELRHLVCGDGVAAIEAEFIGRHIGEFAGIEATGVTVRLPYTVFYELDGDRISALRAYISLSGIAAQLQPAGQATTATT